MQDGGRGRPQGPPQGLSTASPSASPSSDLQADGTHSVHFPCYTLVTLFHTTIPSLPGHWKLHGPFSLLKPPPPSKWKH